MSGGRLRKPTLLKHYEFASSGAVPLDCKIHLNKKGATVTGIFTTEFIVAGTLIFISGVLIVTGLLMALPNKGKKSKVDVEAAVRNAPYHLLANIGIKVSPSSKCRKN